MLICDTCHISTLNELTLCPYCNNPFTREIDPNKNLHEKAYAFLCRHFVGMNIRFTDIYDRKQNTYLSGFITDIDDQWYWVTAGHCFVGSDERPGIDDIIKNESSLCRFVDSFGPEVSDYHSIPFTYTKHCATCINSKYLDFGLIKINDLIRKNMEFNKVVPLEESNWIHQSNLNFDFHVLIGFPFNKNRLCIIPVKQLTNSERFKGKVPNTIDVRGTSGGPILGFRILENGQLAYHIVAIQSSREKNNPEIIYGCKIPEFVDAARKKLS